MNSLETDIQVLTYNDIWLLTNELAKKIRVSNLKPEILIGIARGGLVVTRLLSDIMDIFSVAIIGVGFYDGIKKTKKEPILTQELHTDLTDKKGLSFYKRLLDMDLYVRKEDSGTLTIEIKRDNETTWQTVGTIDLSGDEDILIQHLAVDLRAKTFLIKVSGTDHYRFLGILFKSLVDDEQECISGNAQPQDRRYCFYFRKSTEICIFWGIYLFLAF